MDVQSGGRLLCSEGPLSPELRRLADYGKNFLCLRMLFKLLRPDLPKMRASISKDNEGAIKSVSNPICTNCTKHVDV